MHDQKIKNMEEFAALSGLSRPTVSKYFNDPESVRPSTRERIEKALEHYDYRPNFYAVNQNRRLTKNIGILVPYLSDPFFAEIARNLERRCIEAGFSPILFSAHGEQSVENEILNTLRDMKPAGVLMAPLGRGSDKNALARFCEDVPTVLFDSYVEGIGEAFVGSDNHANQAIIVEYLCRTGEPPNFFEMATPANPNANRRRVGYVAAMQSLGLEPNIVNVDGTGWDFEAIGYKGGLKAIAGRQFTSDTVLCSNDRLAIGLLAAAYESGLRIGRGRGCALRIAGHDNHPFSRFTSPPLTTISQNYVKITARSVEILFDVIDSGERLKKHAPELIGGSLVMRDSA